MSDIATVIEKAFDYRGDVTLDLKDGRQVIGFVTNREANGTPSHPEPFVEMMLAEQGGLVRFNYSDIAGIRFTGEDTAAGKSWAEWVGKHETLKKAAGKS